MGKRVREEIEWRGYTLKLDGYSFDNETTYRYEHD
jgi:hypothetical protein